MLEKMENLTESTNRLKVHLSDDQLVIGIDFGTTFSGFAYAFYNPSSTSTSKLEAKAIMEWPGCERQPKVPTLISYNDDGTFAWGAQKNKGELIEGLKLLLDTQQEVPIYLPSADLRADLKKLGGRQPVDVAADYLGALYKHAMLKLESKVPREFLLTCQKQFVLTVPAVWSDKARNTTLQAAKKAGIHPVTLVKEPEAAAMYTLHMMEERSLAIGDAFVLCDAGGGTVDLISYEILELSPRLVMKELVPGKGGMAGSLGLNKRFGEEVKALVGEDQWYELRKSNGFEQAAKQFNDSIKVKFKGDLDDEYDVNFPRVKLKDDAANNLETNCWTMKGEVVARIFAPFLAEIQRYVQEQVLLVKNKRMTDGHAKANEIKAIFLVGGFGSSEYLKTSLESAFPDTQVIQPHDAWAAIVKGAVLHKLPQQALVESTQATRHYGVEALCLYDAAEDKGQPRIPDIYDGKDKVMKMTWYIYRGEDLRREQTIHFPFYRSLPENFSPSQLIFKDQLIQCETNEAPRYPSSATKMNCMLTADLTKVNPSHFKKNTTPEGTAYYDVLYNLVVNIQPAVMKFSLEIDGKELGSVDANYS